METPVRHLAGGIAAAILIGTGGIAANADQAAIAPPKGSAPLLELTADGVQIYTCEAKEGGFDWSFKAPEANLFDKQGRQVGTHFAGPTWKFDDGSEVVGEVIAKADATEPRAIQWLLLSREEPSRVGRGCPPSLISVGQRQRAGEPRAPAGGASHRARQARVRYSAVYQFFSAAK